MRKLGMLVIIAFLSLMLVTTVNAAPTLISPTTSDLVTGSWTFNATTALLNSANCTFYAKSASTVNSSWGELGMYTNTSTGQLINFTVVYDTTGLEDGADYEIKVTCYNETSESETLTTTGITIDNTIPSVTLVTPVDKAEVSTLSMYTATVTDSKITESVLLYIGSNIFTMSCTGDTCTYTTAQGDIPAGNHNWYVYGSDGTNTTSAVSYDVWVAEGTEGDIVGPAVAAQLQQTKEKKEKESTVFGAILAIAAIALIWYYYIRKK